MQVAERKLPHIVTALPGPNAKRIIERDHTVVSPSYTRDYPMVAKTGRGAMVEDTDGNTFLDFAAGVAVVAGITAVVAVVVVHDGFAAAT